FTQHAQLSDERMNRLDLRVRAAHARSLSTPPLSEFVRKCAFGWSGRSPREYGAVVTVINTRTDTPYMSYSPAIADSTPPKRRIRLTPRRARASAIAAVVIGLVITGCAGPTNDGVTQGEPASTEAESAAAAEEAAEAAPAESASPIPWTPTE